MTKTYVHTLPSRFEFEQETTPLFGFLCGGIQRICKQTGGGLVHLPIVSPVPSSSHVDMADPWSKNP